MSTFLFWKSKCWVFLGRHCINQVEWINLKENNSSAKWRLKLKKLLKIFSRARLSLRLRWNFRGFADGRHIGKWMSRLIQTPITLHVNLKEIYQVKLTLIEWRIRKSSQALKHLKNCSQTEENKPGFSWKTRSWRTNFQRQKTEFNHFLSLLRKVSFH